MSELLRICVDFDRRDDPIAGRLFTGRGQQRFTGWLGLIAALEGAVGARADRESCEGADGTGPLAGSKVGDHLGAAAGAAVAQAPTAST